MPTGRPARLTALALLAACSAAFAPAPAHRAPRAKPDRRTDEEKLQGTWEEVSCSINGKAGKSSGDWSAVFAGGRLSFYTKGKEAKSWSFSLDPTTSPKRILLRGAAGERLECIYRLEGDRLTTCWRNGRPGPCPTAFEGGPGLGLDVYRRVKRGK